MSTERLRHDLARLALIALYPLRMVEHLTRPPHMHLHSADLHSADRKQAHR